MSSEDVNFIEDVIAGQATSENFNNYIDQWHQADTDKTLPQWLGITNEEYFEFLSAEPGKVRETIENIINNYQLNKIAKYRILMLRLGKQLKNFRGNKYG